MMQTRRNRWRRRGPLYGFMAVRWQLFGDFADVIRGQVSGHAMRRPRGWDLLVLLGGKAFFLALAFGVPHLLHPWWVVLVFYAATSMVALYLRRHNLLQRPLYQPTSSQ